MNKIDPFTRTPGVAGEAFIDMHHADEVIENYVSDISSKRIYKIVGLRGSGKSVEYRKIINTLSDRKDWLVYTLSATGDPVNTLIAKLSKETFIDSKKHITTVQSGGGTEATLSDMIQEANDKGYKILVGVDDIAKTDKMKLFLSILGSLLLDDKKRIYFICTGLAQNIEDFANEPNLTFFKRSNQIEIKTLDKFEIAAMYQKLLNVEREESVRLSKFTCGYAYAYQVLGSLYFNKKEEEALDDLLSEFEKVIFRDSYDLIWKSLTAAERELAKAIVNSETGKTSEIKEKMKSPSGYDSLRMRLDNKHLIDISEWGYIKINLPRFKEYIRLWHNDE